MEKSQEEQEEKYRLQAPRRRKWWFWAEHLCGFCEGGLRHMGSGVYVCESCYMKHTFMYIPDYGVHLVSESITRESVRHVRSWQENNGAWGVIHRCGPCDTVLESNGWCPKCQLCYRPPAMTAEMPASMAKGVMVFGV